MAETRHRSEDAVRVVENGKAGKEDVALQDLERRLSSLQNDVSQLAYVTSLSQRPAADPNIRLGAPSFFSTLAGLGQVPFNPAPVAGMASPLPGPFGAALPAPMSNEGVSTREFSALASVTRQPGVNIVDSGEEYVVQVELPGVKKKDLELLGSERALTLMARVRTEPPDDVEGTVLLAECAPTVYRRTIHLPSLCNTARCRASLKDGWLTLNVPKKDASSAIRRIDVAYG